MKDILRFFGERALQERLKKKLSQEKMAELACLHRTYISQVEAGRRNISLKNIEKIAGALNTSVAKLLNGYEQ